APGRPAAGERARRDRARRVRHRGGRDRGGAGRLRRVGLVLRPATHAGFWPAITRRQSPPSLLPRLPALAASECGVWPGARDPEARRHHWTGHRLGGNGFRLFRLLCLGLGLRGLVRLLLWLAGLLARLR